MALFDRTFTQYIEQVGALDTVRPFTIGAWYRCRTTSTASIFGLTETVGNTGFNVYCTSTGVSTAISWWTGTATSGTGSAVSTRNEWNYVCARFVATANKWISNITPDAIYHTQQTSSRTPGALNTLRFGGSIATVAGTISGFDGDLAEVFFADADIQPGGLQLHDNILLQLAFNGPWSLPHLARNIVEYRSLRHGAGTNADDVPGDDYQRRGLRTWTEVNGPIMAGEGPPISANYVRPNQVPRLLMV